jgi:hypothetical protein
MARLRSVLGLSQLALQFRQRGRAGRPAVIRTQHDTEKSLGAGARRLMQSQEILMLNAWPDGES